MAPRSETRKNLIDSTARLIQRRGLHGTGLLEVLEHSGAPRGSLYFHFPEGKTQLAAEAVDAAATVVERWITRSLAQTSSTADAVALLLDRYAEGQDRTAFSEGCAVAGVALDLSSGDDVLFAVCRHAMARWRAPLAEALLAEDRAKPEAEALATTIIAVVEGALLMARIERSTGPFLAAKRSLQMLLGAPRSARRRRLEAERSVGVQG